MSRVKIIYADGENSYGELNLNADPPYIDISGAQYDLETFAKTEATIAVNDRDMLKALLDNGVKARPTPAQEKISISVPVGMKERLTNAAKRSHRSVSSVLTELAEDWIKQQGE